MARGRAGPSVNLVAGLVTLAFRPKAPITSSRVAPATLARASTLPRKDSLILGLRMFKAVLMPARICSCFPLASIWARTISRWALPGALGAGASGAGLGEAWGGAAGSSMGRTATGSGPASCRSARESSTGACRSKSGGRKASISSSDRGWMRDWGTSVEAARGEASSSRRAGAWLRGVG